MQSNKRSNSWYFCSFCNHGLLSQTAFSSGFYSFEVILYRNKPLSRVFCNKLFLCNYSLYFVLDEGIDACNWGPCQFRVYLHLIQEIQSRLFSAYKNTFFKNNYGYGRSIPGRNQAMIYRTVGPTSNKTTLLFSSSFQHYKLPQYSGTYTQGSSWKLLKYILVSHEERLNVPS